MNEATYWRQRYEVLMATFADAVKAAGLPPPPVMLADKESYEAGRIAGMAAQQQEPLAWVREHELPLAPGEAFSWVETFFHKTPLYTSPQSKPWVGLTPRERIMCRSYDPEEAVAKTEAKLKEKNA